MPNSDPQTVWQNQNAKEFKMSLTELRQKAEQQRTRNRWLVVGNDLAYLAVIAFLALIFAKTPNITSRAGLALIAAGSLYILYQRHKHLWPGLPVSDAPPDSGLEVYRRELLRWRADQSNALRMLAPLLPGAIVFALPSIAPLVRTVSTNPAILINALPLCVLLGVFLVGISVVRKRNLKKINQELDALGG